MKKIILIYIFLFIICNIGFSQDEISVTAKASKLSIDISEAFTFIIKIEGSFKQTPKIEMPELIDFSVLAKNNSSSFVLVKGEAKSVIEIELVLKAVRNGELEIPQCIVRHNDKVYKTDLIKITVSGKMPALPSQDQAQDKEEITL